MNRRALLFAVAITLLQVPALLAADAPNWQTGKTLSSERQQVCAKGAACVYQDFEFEGEKKVYTAREHLKWIWSKEANVTVNGPVKFAVDPHERKLVVLDDDGKRHEMEIIRKAFRDHP